MARPQAKPGDQLLVPEQREADADTVKIGTVIEVLGADGTGPFLVRWEDASESVLYPSTATRVLPSTHNGCS